MKGEKGKKKNQSLESYKRVYKDSQKLNRQFQFGRIEDINEWPVQIKKSGWVGQQSKDMHNSFIFYRGSLSRASLSLNRPIPLTVLGTKTHKFCALDMLGTEFSRPPLQPSHAAVKQVMLWYIFRVAHSSTDESQPTRTSVAGIGNRLGICQRASE